MNTSLNGLAHSIVLCVYAGGACIDERSAAVAKRRISLGFCKGHDVQVIVMRQKIGICQQIC